MNSEILVICFEFANSGQCYKKHKCPFPHKTRKEAFNENGYNVFESKGYCQNLTWNGRCIRGSKCMYTHSLYVEQQIIHKDTTTYSLQPITKVNEAKTSKLPIENNKSILPIRLPPAEEICYFFAKFNTCKNGNMCKIKHISREVAIKTYSSFREIKGECYNIRNRGFCNGGDLCNYSHVLT